MSRRFRRAQPVSHRSVAFNDDRDSIGRDLLDAGADPIAATFGAPRPLVHRFTEFDHPSAVRRIDALLPGYGAGEPHEDLWRIRRRRLVVPSASGSVRRFHSASPQVRASWQSLNVLRFPFPRSVDVCVKRKTRRNVLFAKGVAGRRGGSPGPYKRTVFSAWSC